MAEIKSTPRPEWLEGVPSAEAVVECGEQQHTLRWEAGRLLLLDHDDPESERALVALGGEPCRCVELLSAWERHVRDPEVLAIGPHDQTPLSEHDWGAAVRAASSPRGRTKCQGRQGRKKRHVRHDAPAPLGPAGNQPDVHLAELLHLNSTIPHRLVATVAAAMAEFRPDPDLWGAEYSALFARVAVSIPHWSPDDTDFVLEMTEHGDHGFSRTEEGALLVRLPFTWIRDVWARDLAVLDHEFVLAAEVFEPGLLKVTSVNRVLDVHIEPVPYELSEVPPE